MSTAKAVTSATVELCGKVETCATVTTSTTKVGISAIASTSTEAPISATANTFVKVEISVFASISRIAPIYETVKEFTTVITLRVTSQSIRLKTASSSVSVSALNSNALVAKLKNVFKTLNCFAPVSGSVDRAGDLADRRDSRTYGRPPPRSIESKGGGKRQLTQEKKEKVAIPVSSIKTESRKTKKNWEVVNDDVKDSKEDVVAVAVQVVQVFDVEANAPIVSATPIDLVNVFQLRYW
jgi:hypothetical protein